MAKGKHRKFGSKNMGPSIPEKPRIAQAVDSSEAVLSDAEVEEIRSEIREQLRNPKAYLPVFEKIFTKAGFKKTEDTENMVTMSSKNGIVRLIFIPDVPFKESLQIALVNRVKRKMEIEDEVRKVFQSSGIFSLGEIVDYGQFGTYYSLEIIRRRYPT